MAERSYSNAELVEIIREALARTPGRGAHWKLADGFDLATAFYALRHSQASVRATEVLAILRAALAPTGPFIAIPNLSGNFHIRMGRDGGTEVISDNGVRAGRDIALQLRVGRGAVPQKLIDELDQEASATLAAPGKRLTKDARAAFIRERLAKKDLHLKQRTIENRLKAMPH